MSPITISIVVFGCVCGGVLLGIGGQFLLPGDHRDSDTKEVVRLGMAVVGTMVALVLGLLIASSKGFYDSQNSEVTEMAADVVLLDRVLAHYGPDAKEARAQLRSSVGLRMNVAGQRHDPDKSHFDPAASSDEGLFDKIQELSPQNDNQRLLQTQALGLAIKLGQTRWLMFEQKTTSVPMPLLAVLVFWIALLFMSFALFVRPNTTVVSSLLVSALAVCGAIFLILEMYHPYSGLIHVSDAPMRAALAQLAK